MYLRGLLDVEPLGADPPGCRPLWRQTPLDAEPPGHVTCDVSWEATAPPPTVDRQTLVKTLSCPKLRLQALTIHLHS